MDLAESACWPSRSWQRRVSCLLRFSPRSDDECDAKGADAGADAYVRVVDAANAGRPDANAAVAAAAAAVRCVDAAAAARLHGAKQQDDGVD